MPFTVSHAVVALPFRRLRRWSAPAVAAGAMVPDLPLFAPIGVPYELTHTPWAVPTVDLVLGVVALLLWGLVLRPGLAALAPSVVRVRLPRGAGVPAVPRRAPWVLASIALGSATQVLWDAFTHPGRAGSVLVPALADRLGPLPVTSWLQQGSTLLGLAVLVVVGVVVLRRRPVVDEIAPVLPRGVRRSLAAVAIAAPCAVLGVGGVLAATGAGSALATVTGAVDAGFAVVAVVGAAAGIVGAGRG